MAWNCKAVKSSKFQVSFLLAFPAWKLNGLAFGDIPTLIPQWKVAWRFQGIELVASYTRRLGPGWFRYTSDTSKFFYKTQCFQNITTTNWNVTIGDQGEADLKVTMNGTWPRLWKQFQHRNPLPPAHAGTEKNIKDSNQGRFKVFFQERHHHHHHNHYEIITSSHCLSTQHFFNTSKHMPL